MSIRGHRAVVGGLVAGLAASLVLSAPAQAAPEPVGLTPTPQELVRATNSMLSFDLDPVLAAGSDGRYSTGYNNPPGGQDPLPVCVYGPDHTGVQVPDNDATGFMATNGFVTQSVYAYPTEVAYAGATLGLDAAIVKNCSGKWRDDGVWSVKRSLVPASGSATRGWAVTTRTPSSVQYSVIVAVRGAIQVVSYYRESTSLQPGVTAAIDALSARLAERWAAQETLENTQGPLLTGAEVSMLMPSDVPAELPVTSPKNDGWSMFNAATTGLLQVPCGAFDAIPAGSWTFMSSLGGQGGVTAEPGQLLQAVSAYQSNDAAAAAWSKLRSVVAGCKNVNRPALSQTKDVDWLTTGTSQMTYGGVPGVWSRELSTFTDGDGGFTVKAYNLFLLVDNTIQQYTYYLSRDGIAQIPLDQLAVNQLAQTLADRWVAAQ